MSRALLVLGVCLLLAGCVRPDPGDVDPAGDDVVTAAEAAPSPSSAPPASATSTNATTDANASMPQS